MNSKQVPDFLVAATAPSSVSKYPAPLAYMAAGRSKRKLGDLFGLTNFGINLTSLAPNAMSALRHAHSRQDEFIFVLEGSPTLHTDHGRFRLFPGACAGFKAATGNAHHLVNETDDEVVYLEIGDRTPGDEGFFPDDDLMASFSDGKWTFLRKDGTPYE